MSPSAHVGVRHIAAWTDWRAGEGYCLDLRASRDHADEVPPSQIAIALHSALDPVLGDAGFAAGQGDSEQMIFCASHDEFSDRYPTLPQSNEQDRGLGCCIDLMVEIDDDNNRFRRVDLENLSVVDTLRAAGRVAEADALRSALAADLDEALPALVHGLRALFPSC